ncbi:MAG: 3-deoxy-manno-octulosonate cytidylyltransferase, partial [Alphaproteobacteria bacterium]|nr:3-deoxy-manno-octulosonate cytidylyltransferase [Alphaproteobacteria bacterium]
MIENHNTLIVIPARMASARLPGKALADLNGQPMILHVWQRAVAAGLGKVLVAAGEIEIAETIRRAGGDAIVTNPGLPSGTDRIAEALHLRDPEGRYGHILSLPCDVPTIDLLAIQRCLVG